MKDRQINFRVSEDVHAVLELGARESGLSLSAWLTVLGLTAVGKSKLLEQLERTKPAKKPRR